MEFKIFKASSFSEADINAFLNENIILKDKFLENGDIYVYFNNRSKIGSDAMSEIKTIDRMVTQAQQEILVARFDIVDLDTKLADVEERIQKVKPNQDGWNDSRARESHSPTRRRFRNARSKSARSPSLIFAALIRRS
jgi:hypothetical protein